jgi:hypothetical protein
VFLARFFLGSQKNYGKSFSGVKKGFYICTRFGTEVCKNMEGKGRKFIEKIETTARIERYETN